MDRPQRGRCDNIPAINRWESVLIRPYGTRPVFPAHPAINRWAISDRP